MEQVVLVQVDRRAQPALGARQARDVVDVGVRQEDVRHDELLGLDKRQQFVHFVPRVHVHRLSRALAPEDEPVFHERRRPQRFR